MRGVVILDWRRLIRGWAEHLGRSVFLRLHRRVHVRLLRAGLGHELPAADVPFSGLATPRSQRGDFNLDRVKLRITYVKDPQTLRGSFSTVSTPMFASKY